MWLINASTLKLQYFVSTITPTKRTEYAILSHTWGQDEVTFQDMQNLDIARRKAGFAKIEKTCAQAKSDGLGFAWVDTCCIDKSSSAELQEAINSMYVWYAGSRICYAYLEDIRSKKGEPHGTANIVESRWFTRGWTLQELIAPKTLEFFDTSWEPLGKKGLYEDPISKRTGIPVKLLRGGGMGQDLRSYSSAEKMSWASNRETTRIEDQAYCLLGLFGVVMPLLYGEGRKSFIRLQEEILRVGLDLSLLLWDLDPFDADHGWVGQEESLFAPSPRNFSACGNVQYRDSEGQGWTWQSAAERIVSAVGLKTNLPIIPLENKRVGEGEEEEEASAAVLLHCFDRLDPTVTIALRVLHQPFQHSTNSGLEHDPNATLYLLPYDVRQRRRIKLDVIEAEELTKTSIKPVVLLRHQRLKSAIFPTKRYGQLTDTNRHIWLRFTTAKIDPWICISKYPADAWDESNFTFAIEDKHMENLREDLPAAGNCFLLERPGVSCLYVTGAIALKAPGAIGGKERLVVSFACPVMRTLRWSISEHYTQEVFFQVDAFESWDTTAVDASEMRKRCDDLVYGHAYSAEYTKLTWYRDDDRAGHGVPKGELNWQKAKGVELNTGRVFAVKPEVKQIGRNWIVILHTFDFLENMEQVRKLDEDEHLPVNQRAGRPAAKSIQRFIL